MWSLQERVRHLAWRLEGLAIGRTCRELGITHADRIPTYTSPSELRGLFRLARACPPNGTIVEVGAYVGAATCYLAAGLSLRGGRIYCVDTWNNETMPEGIRDTFAEFTHNTSPLREMIVRVRKRSTDVDRSDIQEAVDLVFIDADHTYSSVRRDFDHYSTFLADGGILAFHDCNAFIGVTRVIAEALASERWVVMGQQESLLWMRRRTEHD